jgi:phosphonate transport system ATP-binding protein
LFNSPSPLTSLADGIVLQTDAVGVVYNNGTRALHPTSVAFRQGEFTVLLGASGAGKSTLLRTLNGLVRPSSGKVVSALAGDISRPSALRKHRRQTGVIFQQHHLIGRLSVLSNVLTGRLGYYSTWATLLPWPHVEKERALAVIERVGMLDWALQRADQLSGGQQQRVGIARALVQHPKLLLADEPIASLDPATAENLLTLLLDVCRNDGLTVIVSLHQVEFARRFADRIIGLKGGAIVFDGTAGQLTPELAKSLYGPIQTSVKPINTLAAVKSVGLHCPSFQTPGISP